MINDLIRRVEQAAMAVSVGCVVVLMLIVCYDATARYLFSAPLPWATDVITYYLLLSAIYFAVASTFRHGDHINIDLVHAKLAVRVRVWSDAVWTVLAACLFAVIAYATLSHGMDALARGEFYPGYTRWPVWLSYLPITIGSALLVLRLLLHAVMLIQSGGDSYVQANPEVHVE